MRAATTLSEYESKRLLADLGVAVPDEYLASDPAEAVAAATRLGWPVVVKLTGAAIAHKTERQLVRLALGNERDVERAARELLHAATPADGAVGLLVAPMISGARELIAGLVRDAQFGPMVMVGIGGVLAEAVGDVVFRPAPFERATAAEMLDDLRLDALLGPLRGQPAVDREALIDTLSALARIADERPDIGSVDINPLIVDHRGVPVVADALVELGAPDAGPAPVARACPSAAAMRALFEPRGVVVAGASTHPGKFGFVALHNLLAAGYQGAVWATNLGGERVLAIDTVRSIDEIPAGQVDLAVLCTPAEHNPAVLRQCAAKGIGAAFVTSAGYREAGPAGLQAERELAELAAELGILLAGPNGQGLVSTPANLCAQIVAPYPPSGPIAVASQSGNLMSSFLNMARATGIGISRAVSVGNAAMVGVADYVDFYASDPATRVGLAYLESTPEGGGLIEILGAAAGRKPLVVIKGGATSGGARAAASHTGALAADDRLFDGACRGAGITRARSVEEAFDTAATFATQPLPSGRRVVVLTTAGGWGVLTADAIGEHPDLELLDLPGELRATLDALLPERWSRNNPIDCAGGETRDTISEVLTALAAHDAVDSIVYLGLGIQSNQARTMRDGPFFPDHGLARIVDYHERQDRRFAEIAAELSWRYAKPILCVTELASADPGNAGADAVRRSGRLAYPSGERAVAALGHLSHYAAWRRARERR